MLDFFEAQSVLYFALGYMMIASIALPLLFKKRKYAGSPTGLPQILAIVWYGFTIAITIQTVENMQAGTSTWVHLAFAAINVFFGLHILYITVLRDT